jgi:hypothetical protein
VARRDPFPYQSLETVLGLLTSGPEPLSLDGRLIGHSLPARPIPLDELRSMLLHPSVGFAARDAAVAELARRARRDRGPDGRLAGVLLPRLRRLTTPLARACPGQAADLEAAVLAGLVEAVGVTGRTDLCVVTVRPAPPGAGPPNAVLGLPPSAGSPPTACWTTSPTSTPSARTTGRFLLHTQG